MKVHYKDLLNFLSDTPSEDLISEKLFQLGHEHELNNGIFDIEITPNRGDCLSLLGLSRDLNIFFGNKNNLEIYDGPIDELNLDFRNKSKIDCPKISFLEIEIANKSKKYKPYLESYFTNLNQKKINFFTDISNYLSYEIGQPTHCYDRKKIKGQLTFQSLEINAKFTTLLKSDISLSGENCVFLDNNEIINLAGVMGGLSTSCSDDTETALIECAYFKPESIIGKSVKYNLFSDAAYKFERGVDISSQIFTLRRFIKIVSDHSEIKKISIKTFDDYEPINDGIKIDVNKINKILGTEISEQDYLHYLDKLGFEIRDKIYPPEFRSDIQHQNDLSEEVARLIGYNNISSKPINIESKNQNNAISKIDILRSFLTKNGFTEVVNFPFVKEKSIDSISIDNPLDSTKRYMRTSLKSSLIDDLLYNERRQKESIKLFEISEIYLQDEVSSRIGIIASGRVADNYLDFSRKIDTKYLDNIFNDDLDMGIHFDLIPRDSIDSKKKSKVFFAEVNINEINDSFFASTDYVQSNINFVEYSEISEYPSSTRDFSFLIQDAAKVEEIIRYFEGFQVRNLKDSFMFDFYENTDTGEVKIGYRFIFQSFTKTLEEKEINSLVSSILEPVLSIEGVSIPGM